jgi:putative ribosome biogenesis GTPase RsgA
MDKGAREGSGHGDPFKGELPMYFPETLNLLTECQFYNSAHDHEPGCAAVNRGVVSGERNRNYLSMLSGCDRQSRPWELKQPLP